MADTTPIIPRVTKTSARVKPLTQTAKFPLLNKALKLIIHNPIVIQYFTEADMITG